MIQNLEILENQKSRFARPLQTEMIISSISKINLVPVPTPARIRPT